MPEHYLTHTENHRDIARSHLPEQYKNRPNIDGLLSAIISPLQEAENTLYEIYRNYSLAEARGPYLDRIGALTGEPRGYRRDNEYRLAILARIMINNAGGTPEDIINALKFTFRPEKLSYTEIYPACFSVFIQGTRANSGTRRLIKSIIPAGISSFVIVFSTENDPFIFAECSNEVVPLEIRTAIEDDADGAEVNTDIDVQSFDVSADVLLFPEGHPGFAEIIIARTGLSLGEDDIYFTEDGVPLELIPAYEDFKIGGGSKLAEVIEHG